MRFPKGSRAIEWTGLANASLGINSYARKQFLGHSDVGAQKTGWAAFRMMVDVEKIKRNPETRWITEKQDLHLW